MKLSEQPFRILRYLAEHPAEIVTRDELQRLLWGEGTFVDFEHGLNAAVNKIREALGDSAATPRYIETVPRRGYRFVGDVVRPPATAVPQEVLPSPSAPPSPPKLERSWATAWWVGGSILLATGAFGLWWGLSRVPRAAPELVMRPLTADSGLTTAPVLSRDGRMVAYASSRAVSKNLDIWVHPLAKGSEPIRLTSHPAPDYAPDISPDGGLIVFRSDRDGGGIYVIPSQGGEERLLVHGGVLPRFSPDGKTIAYCMGRIWEAQSRIYVIPVDGGTARELALDVPWSCNPVFSTDGQHLLFEGASAGNDLEHDLWATPFQGGPSVRTGAFRLIADQMQTRVIPFLIYPDVSDRGCLFAFGGRVWELNLKGPDWKARGPARPLTSGSNIILVRAGTEGRMVFFDTQSSTHLWKLRLNHNTGRVLGEPEALPHSGGWQSMPSASGDGRLLAYNQSGPDGASIHLRDLRTSKETTLVHANGRPHVSPDGSRVAYGVLPDSIYVISSKGGEAKQLVSPSDKLTTWVFGWAPDGKKIVYWFGKPIQYSLLDPDTRQSTVLLAHPKYPAYNVQFSPDQRWVAFNLPGERSNPMWVASYRDGKVAPESDWISVSSDGDLRPWWSPNGNLLYTSSRRDGWLCIWAQPLEPVTKRPRGEGFAVQHFHGTGSILAVGAYFGPAILPDGLIFGVIEGRGNVWIVEPKK